METFDGIDILRRYNADVARLRSLTAQHEELSSVVVSWTYAIRRLLGRNTALDRVELAKKDREISGLVEGMQRQEQDIARLEAASRVLLRLDPDSGARAGKGLNLAALRIIRRYELEGSGGAADFETFARGVWQDYCTLESMAASFLGAFADLQRIYRYTEPAARRCAALGLVNAARHPDSLPTVCGDVNRLVSQAAEFFVGDEPARRFLFGASIVGSGGDFWQRWERVRKIDGLLSGMGLAPCHHRCAAALVLALGCATDDDLDQRLRRIPLLLALMKEHHFWLTGKDDYPMAAVLAGLASTVEDTIAKVERIYQELTGWGFKTGNPLQSTSHLLALSDLDPKRVTQRFTQVWKALTQRAGAPKEADLFPEVATLTLLPGVVDGIVDLFEVAFRAVAAYPDFAKDGVLAATVATAILKWALFDDREFLEEALVADVHRYAELTIRQVEVAAAAVAPRA